MNAPASTRNPYFLTRQSANLMEDLQRQISTAGAICLLYGAKGVGKSRLLDHFLSTRLVNQQVRYIKPSTEGFYINGDRQLIAYGSAQSGLFGEDDDVLIIIDQIETEAMLLLEQIFSVWSKRSVTHNYRLILACQPDILKPLFELSNQYQLKIMGVELKPFSNEESLQYLTGNLCQQNSIPNLPVDLMRQMKQSAGLPELLNRIIEQYSNQIECPGSEKNSGNNRAGYLLIYSGLLLLGVVVLLIFDRLQYIDEIPLSQENQQPASNTTSQNIYDSSVNSESIKQVPIPTSIVSTITQQGENQQTRSTDLPEAEDEIPLSVETKEKQFLVEPEDLPERLKAPLKEENILTARLEATKQWLQSSSDETASIQIMSLGFSSRPEQPLLSFLKTQTRYGTDLNNLYIYRFRKANVLVYVVLFGSYPDRNLAKKNLKSLPPALKANGPIVRTVQGIKHEIQKG